MTRCFVAIDFPDEVNDRLLAMQPMSLPNMRLISRDQMHLTLHFLGELADESFEHVRQVLGKTRAAPFTVNLSGLGQFPAQGPPRVLWAGVEPSPTLIALHHSLGKLLTDEIGYVPENRPFSPHITLARFNGPTSRSKLDHHLKANAGFRIADISVNQFVLYSSKVVDRAPKYTAEVVVPFSS